MLRVKETIWITNRDGCVGFCLCENEQGKKSIRVGLVPGQNEEEDINHVVDFGAKLHRSQVARMILHFAGEENKEEGGS